MEVIYLPNYDIVYLGKKAEELGFVRDTLEKVTRLADTLEYLNTNPILIHVPRIPPPLNYLARINESEGGGMNRFMSVYNTFVGV